MSTKLPRLDRPGPAAFGLSGSRASSRRPVIPLRLVSIVRRYVSTPSAEPRVAATTPPSPIARRAPFSENALLGSRAVQRPAAFSSASTAFSQASWPASSSGEGAVNCRWASASAAWSRASSFACSSSGRVIPGSRAPMIGSWMSAKKAPIA